MVYEYKSDEGKIISIKRSMKSRIPEQITRKGVLYKRVFSVPHIIFFGQTPKTIGALAEQNTKRMIKDGTLPKSKKPKMFDKKQRKHLNDLSKLSAAQKERYIITGKK